MILRLSQKLNTKVKAGQLFELPLADNPFADWSSHLFAVNRTQHIMLTNTVSLYSCLMLGRGITDGSTFAERALNTIRLALEDDGRSTVFKNFIAPASGTINFAKAFNRSVTGSMNDHVHAAKFMLEDGITLSEIRRLLNETPMSALQGPDGRKYGYPKDVFASLEKQMGNE